MCSRMIKLVHDHTRQAVVEGVFACRTAHIPRPPSLRSVSFNPLPLLSRPPDRVLYRAFREMYNILTLVLLLSIVILPQEGDDALPPPPLRKPRDTLVQDYLGREGAEQFLSDWDEERSSTSESESCRLSQHGVTSRQSQWELARVHVERQGIMVASSRVSSVAPETTRQVAAAVPKGDLLREEGVAAGSLQASLSPQDMQTREAHRNPDSDNASASASTPKKQEQEADRVGVRQVRGRAACIEDIIMNDFSVPSPAETSTGLDLDKGGAGRSGSTAEGGRRSPSVTRRRRRAGEGAGRGTYVAKVSSSEGIFDDDGSGLNSVGKTGGENSEGCGASTCAGGRGGVFEERREALPRGDRGRSSLLDLADQSMEDI